VVSSTPRKLYSQVKSRRYPLDRTLGRPQSRSGRCGEEKNLEPLAGIELRPSSLQPFAIPTELSRLSNVIISNIKIFTDIIITVPRIINTIVVITTITMLLLPPFSKHSSLTSLFTVIFVFVVLAASRIYLSLTLEV
jgi:hypothetical protein